MQALFVFVLMLLTMSLAPVPKGLEPKAEGIETTELKKLEGIWAVEKVTLGGRDFPANPVKYEFKGPLMTLVGTDGVRMLKVDGSKDPKRMTQTEAELKNGSPVAKAGGQVNRAIYKIDGDKLTMVIGRGPKPDFPKSITPEAADPVLVMILKRVKD